MKVLLVGQNREAMEALSRLLARSSELQVVTDAAGVASALSPVAPALIVLTEPTPDQDVVAVCRSLRAQATSSVLVAVVNGWKRVAELLAAGADDVHAGPGGMALEARLRVALRLSDERLRLQRGEDRLRGALDRSIDGLSLHDGEGRTLYMSPSVTRMLGYGAAELLQRPLFSGVHPDDLDKVTAVQDHLQNHPGASVRVECRVQGADGQLRWLEAIGTNLLDDPAVRAIVGNFRDITEQKRLSEALQASEARYRRIVETTSEGIWLLDAHTNTRFMNRRMAEMLGSTVDEIGDRSMLAFVAPDEQAALAELLDLERSDHQPLRRSIKLQRGDGSTVWTSIQTNRMTDEAGVYQGVLAMVTDVSEQRRGDELQARPAAIVECSDDAIVGTDVASGTIASWNGGAERLYGFSAAEAVGKPIEILVPPDRREQELPAMLARLRRGENVQNFETVRLRKDGSTIDVSLILTAIKDRSGRVIGGAATARDLTERKRAEANLRRREAQLYQLQKLDAIGSMAGGIAHDFNNLLSVILSYLKIALEEIPPQYHEVLKEVRRAAERGAELTRQLLAFSRGGAQEARLLDLNDVLASTRRMLEHVLDGRRKLTLQLSPQPMLVYLARGQLEQVLMNLVVNARDATPRGGQIGIETAPVEIDGATAARQGTKAGAYVALSVSDDGTGMDGDTVAHLFEPFFTTKEPGRGTGLGLFTVFGIIRQSGGHIAVESAPGQGTTFRAYLPRAEVGVERPAPVRPLRRGSESVLVVANDVQVLESTRSILTAEGYQVLTATAPEQALAIAERFEGRIDLLVTDAAVPGLIGEALTTRVALLRPQVRLLYVSPNPEPRIVWQRGLCLGFLPGPIVAESLLIKVRQVLDAKVPRSTAEASAESTP